MKVKSVSETTAAWQASHSRVPQAYSAGIARTDGWQAAANSASAKANYEAGISAAIAEDRRGKGLAAVSDAAWKQKAQNKGSKNILTGLAEAVPDYQNQMGKVVSVLQGVNLPARTTDGMTNLTQRAGAVVTALENAKKAGQFR